MKTHRSRRRDCGLTLLEVLVVIFILCFAALTILPPGHTSGRKAQQISCVINLKKTSIAFRIWEGDHHDLFPMAVSCTNGGAMEQVTIGQVARVFEVMSNELSTPKILICPVDDDHFPATNFSVSFSAQNISYFVGVNASEADPKMLLARDDNFEINGVPIESGVLNLTTNRPISWSASRHKFAGNVAMTDGSVQQVSTTGLQDCVSLATNRIAIP